MKHSRYKGFTLIELLVVISIIGLLSSVVLVALQGARAKGVQGAGQQFDDHTYHAYGADAFGLFDFDSDTVGSTISSEIDRSSWSTPISCSGVVAASGGISGNAGQFGVQKSCTFIFSATMMPIIASHPVPPNAGITLSFWIKILTLPSAGDLVTSGGSIGITLAPDGTITASGIPGPKISLNTYTHISISWNTNTGLTKLYVNGSLYGSNMSGQLSSGMWGSFPNIYFGEINPTGSGESFLFDQIRIYNAPI